jgi:predicted nucleic acid-binding protein
MDTLDRTLASVGRYRDQPISLFDAVLAVLARDADVPVWTYDHHFDLMKIAVWR